MTGNGAGLGSRPPVGIPAVAPSGDASGLAALRRLARLREREPEERCELCSAPIAEHPHHEHLLDPAARTFSCACTPCALLFPADAGRRYKRVSRRLWRLDGFSMSDAQWDELAIPVGIAVLHTVGDGGAVRAFYPSPAGPTDCLLSLDGWSAIVEANPALRRLEPDVEALLVHRVRDNRDYFICPIDRCYELVGLIRVHWRGLTGGSAVRERLDSFFDELRERAMPRSGADA